MAEDSQDSQKAPYLPYTSFKRFLSSFKAGAIPSRIDKTLMSGQSGSIQSWIMSALRFFDLIDSTGAPKDSLATLVAAEGEERKKEWKKLFLAGYAGIIDGLDLERATLGQLYERFGKDFSMDTVKKCQSFFAAAAEDAGVSLAEHLKPKARGTGPRKSKKNKPSNTSQSGVAENPHDSAKGLPGSTHASLFLTSDGSRKVVLTAPPTITQSELSRIQQWLSFQLIVEGD